MPAVLIVITGANHWTLTDGTQHPTGFWAEELLTPVSTFRKAGIQLTFATPGGVRPTVDEGSLSPDTVGGAEEAARQRAELDVLFAAELAAPLRLEDVKAADYDAVYVPGGHGPMEDLAVSPAMGELLVGMLDAGKVVSSVCHGPAALLSATRANGEWAFAGRTLSGFLNEEERQAGLADKAPWLLEDRLRAAGAEMEVGDAWAPLSVVDGTIVTGQNPASSGEVAEKVVAQLTA
jgi:putative intracellular protease/amidase